MSEESHEPPHGIKAGQKPGESMRELFHGEENNGTTAEEDARREANVDAAAEQAERIRDHPEHHERQGL